MHFISKPKKNPYKLREYLYSVITCGFCHKKQQAHMVVKIENKMIHKNKLCKIKMVFTLNNYLNKIQLNKR